MFCPRCGRKLDDNVRFCPGCGASINGTPNPSQQPNYQYPNYPQAQPQQHPYYQQQPAAQSTTNTIAIVGFIFSFFVAIVGLICSIIGLSKSKD